LESRFDQYVMKLNNSWFFEGPKAKSVYGGSAIPSFRR
jgi:hypothetical protein